MPIRKGKHGPATRRDLLRWGSLGAAAWMVPGAFAEELERVRTPRQTEGPFYPDTLPLDTDNDLIVLNDALTPAVGEITHLTGRVLDFQGQPIRNAAVEIWQADAMGSYLHSRGANRNNGGQRDDHFQGFGRFLTGSTGDYYFRTIKPVSYPGRAPHIHVIVKKGDQRLLTTQCYIKGHEQNDRDFVLRSVRDPKAREAVQLDYRAISEEGGLVQFAAHFEIVLGLTPEDPEENPGFGPRGRGRAVGRRGPRR